MSLGWKSLFCEADWKLSKAFKTRLVGWVADGWDSVVLNGFDRFGDDSGRGQLKMEA